MDSEHQCDTSMPVAWQGCRLLQSWVPREGLLPRGHSPLGDMAGGRDCPLPLGTVPQAAPSGLCPSVSHPHPPLTSKDLQAEEQGRVRQRPGGSVTWYCYRLGRPGTSYQLAKESELQRETAGRRIGWVPSREPAQSTGQLLMPPPGRRQPRPSCVALLLTACSWAAYSRLEGGAPLDIRSCCPQGQSLSPCMVGGKDCGSVSSWRGAASSDGQ